MLHIVYHILLLLGVAAAKGANSNNFYLFSVAGQQNTTLQYNQVSIKNGDLVIQSDYDTFDTQYSVSKKENLVASIWKNGYLNVVNYYNATVVVVDSHDKRLKLGNMPGAGMFSVKNSALKLGTGATFVACKAKNNDYFTIHTESHSCGSDAEKSYNINLRPNLVDDATALTSYTPEETDKSNFNQTAFSTTLSKSSTSHKSSSTSKSTSSASKKTTLKSVSATKTSSSKSETSTSTSASASDSSSSSDSDVPTIAVKASSTSASNHVSTIIPSQTLTGNVYSSTLFSVSAYTENGEEGTSTYEMITFYNNANAFGGMSILTVLGLILCIV